MYLNEILMNRDIYSTLHEWKNEINRRPLLIRGARQVGKSYAIEEFGRKEFGSIITLNFEKNPEYREIFSSFDPRDICEKISLYTGRGVQSGKTLLFLDEIQECPQAITSLRYFYEEMPLLHVISAGSLLEFALESEKLRMPVGRVQYLYLFPLSFGEFLEALGKGNLRTHILEAENIGRLPGALDNKLNEYVRKYFILGGMPAVVEEYCRTGDVIHCQRIQRLIIDTFRDDFGKYSRKSKHTYLQKIFSAVPAMVGRKFVYSHVDGTVKSRELKEALELLEMAGIVRRVNRTSGAGLPLEAGVRENYFKVLFLDVGLLHAVNGIYSDTVRAKDFTAVFNGAVAEQFVGQELPAYQSPYIRPALYYWARDAKNSSAELDYLVTRGSSIIPVEVKSGSAGRMKSIKMFIDTYKVTRAVRISQAGYNADLPIQSLPFYGIEGFVKG